MKAKTQQRWQMGLLSAVLLSLNLPLPTLAQSVLAHPAGTGTSEGGESIPFIPKNGDWKQTGPAVWTTTHDIFNSKGEKGTVTEYRVQGTQGQKWLMDNVLTPSKTSVDQITKTNLSTQETQNAQDKSNFYNSIINYFNSQENTSLKAQAQSSCTYQANVSAYIYPGEPYASANAYNSCNTGTYSDAIASAGGPVSFYNAYYTQSSYASAAAFGHTNCFAESFAGSGPYNYYYYANLPSC